jgi:hypothetical protein
MRLGGEVGVVGVSEMDKVRRDEFERQRSEMAGSILAGTRESRV